MSFNNNKTVRLKVIKTVQFIIKWPVTSFWIKARHWLMLFLPLVTHYYALTRTNAINQSWWWWWSPCLKGLWPSTCCRIIYLRWTKHILSPSMSLFHDKVSRIAGLKPFLLYNQIIIPGLILLKHVFKLQVRFLIKNPTWF
jgi:hypothetical protein